MAAINQEAMWKAWQDAGTPGEEHQKLQHLVGTWDVAGRTWMGGPGGPVTESKGVVETRWLLPGRWLIEDLTMQMMGMPFQGFAISGYDNVKKKFVGTWVDSMSTALLTMEGNFDAEGTTLACFGTSNASHGRTRQIDGLPHAHHRRRPPRVRDPRLLPATRGRQDTGTRVHAEEVGPGAADSGFLRKKEEGGP
jgi:hypothetical protein